MEYSKHIAEMPEQDSWKVKLSVAVLCVLFISGVAYIDFITGYETAVALLYLVPILSAVWFSWWMVAVVLAVLSGISDATLNYASRETYGLISMVNSAIQVAFFGVFVFVLLALKRSQEGLKKLSRTEPLTGLANSRYFFEEGEAEIQRALRYKHPISLVYIDIDDFKSVNDTVGHSAGDVLLREIAARTKNTIRREDTMARLGGDEFAILLPETDEKAAGMATARIRKSLKDATAHGGRPVTFSMGVITKYEKPCTFSEMIKAADSLMYEAKRGGKDAVKEGVI